MPNWGPIIFQSANEIVANALLRKGLEDIQAQAEPEREWWEKRRTALREAALLELDDQEKEKATTKSHISEDDAVLVDATNTPTATPAATPSGGSKKKKGKK